MARLSKKNKNHYHRQQTRRIANQNEKSPKWNANQPTRERKPKSEAHQFCEQHNIVAANQTDADRLIGETRAVHDALHAAGQHNVGELRGRSGGQELRWVRRGKHKLIDQEYNH
jgi:hypothetical protein